ncbi:MAG: response regulator transcription factor [Bacteroidota bacterium]
MNKRILLIEDEPGLVLTLRKRLESEGFDVLVADNGDAGLEQAINESVDLVLLDVMMPGRDGFEVCSEVRRHKAFIPIMMLTARSQTMDKVLGFRLGADDYLTKPFQMAELIARIKALLRRSTAKEEAINEHRYVFGKVTVDFKRAEVSLDDTLVALSAKEFQLLRYFVEHRGEVRSRVEILNEVWGYPTVPNTRTVDVHVARLRQKIEPNPTKPIYLLTVHNIGYRFDG